MKESALRTLICWFCMRSPFDVEASILGHPAGGFKTSFGNSVIVLFSLHVNSPSISLQGQSDIPSKIQKLDYLD